MEVLRTNVGVNLPSSSTRFLWLDEIDGDSDSRVGSKIRFSFLDGDGPGEACGVGIGVMC
jgi:hypothetical protein